MNTYTGGCGAGTAPRPGAKRVPRVTRVRLQVASGEHLELAPVATLSILDLTFFAVLLPQDVGLVSLALDSDGQKRCRRTLRQPREALAALPCTATANSFDPITGCRRDAAPAAMNSRPGERSASGSGTRRALLAGARGRQAVAPERLGSSTIERSKGDTNDIPVRSAHATNCCARQTRGAHREVPRGCQDSA